MKGAGGILTALWLGLGVGVATSAPAAADEVAEATPEVWAGSFYRAPGGTATVQLPDYDVRNWSAQLYDWNGARVLALYKGTAKSFRAKVSLIFYPRAEKAADAKEVVKTLLEKTMAGAPYLEQTAIPRKMETTAGEGASAAAAGTDKQGVKVEVMLMAFADGKDAVAAMFQASEKEIRTQDVQDLANSFLRTVRVGSRVIAPLSPKAPATAIEGVYESVDHHYLIFDKRGYVSREAPINDLRLDLPVLSQALPDAVGSYAVANGTITATWGETTETAKLAGEVLTVGAVKYWRVDGKRTTAPRGAYEADGHTWAFGDDGTVTADGQPYGSRIEGDRMWLDLPGGSISRPFYPHAKGDGTLTDETLHIGARVYSRMGKGRD